MECMRLLLAIAIDDKIKEVRGQLTWSRDGYTDGRGCLLWPLDAFKVSIEEQLQELLVQESLIYRNQKELTDTTLRERERERESQNILNLVHFCQISFPPPFISFLPIYG